MAQVELTGLAEPCDLLRSFRRPGSATLFLDGRGFTDAWQPGPLVALDPAVLHTAHTRREAQDLLRAVDSLAAQRRAQGGTAETGLALLLAYDLFEDDPSNADGFPRAVVLSVDRSLRYDDTACGLLTVRAPSADVAADPDETRRWADRIAASGVAPDERRAVRATSRPWTSLPREAYLRAVGSVQRHIRRGDIYQANLTQRLGLTYRGDPYELFARLTSALPSPHSAYLETPGVALASISPETFLRVPRPGELETRPIKGTRPRGTTPELDRAAARELLGSGKDRAELLMIVDLERNDLSRVCEVGSVTVRELAALRSFPTVHHLMAIVRGRLCREAALAEMLEATFPGGSITGAPKRRAMQILKALEPVSRNYFTGSLLWIADDGTLDSSILIRTLVFGSDRVYLGAGGGIVADSEADAEWEESNHKARGLAGALGFDPREAGESPR